MKINATNTLLIGMVCLAIVAPPSIIVARDDSAKPQSARITAVISGDEVEIELTDGKKTLMIYAIDAPERKQRFFAEARSRTSQLLLGKQVTIELRQYGKRDRRAFITLQDGTKIHKLLVQEGWAWWDSPRATDEVELANLEAVAHQQGLGIWQQERPLAPWIFGKGILERSLQVKDPWTDCSPPTSYCSARYDPAACTLSFSHDPRRFSVDGSNMCVARRLLEYQSCRAGMRIKRGSKGLHRLSEKHTANGIIREGRIYVQEQKNWRKRQLSFECVKQQTQNEKQATGNIPVDLQQMATQCQSDADCAVSYVPECQKGCAPPCGEVHNSAVAALNISGYRNNWLKSVALDERRKCQAMQCQADCSQSPPLPADLAKFQASCLQARCQIKK